MNLKDLQYYQKLTQLNNYSETAKFFKVSQPTISYAIKRLEKEYDISLIERKSYANSVSLTLAGRQFLRHAENIIRENDLIKKDFSRISSQKIRMGFPPIISDYLMPIVFDDLKESQVLSQIIPQRSGSKELLSELYQGNIDISLLGTTNLSFDGDFDFKILKTHQFKIIASSKRHFPKELKIKDLQAEDFLVLDESSVHQSIVNNLMRKYNVFTNVSYQTSDYKLILELVKNDKGISLITETALQDFSGIQTLNVVDEIFPPFYIVLIYRNSLQKDKMMNKLIHAFSEISEGE